MMCPPLRIVVRLLPILPLVGAIVLLPGCVSQPAAVDYYMRSEYRISVRDPGLVRPAKLSGVRLTDLRRLNPGLKQGKTLPSGPHRLLVPLGTGSGLRPKLSGSQLRLPTVTQVDSPASS
jgi:hypothetical protein